MPLNEIAASLYPWDLADEGIEQCLDVLSSRAEVNSAYLVALPHKEKRPLVPRFYPHNPVRRFYLVEDSRVFWRPTPSHYARIKPLETQQDFLAGTDWLQTLVAGARSHGMRTGAEVSHTLIDSQFARENVSDVLQRDIFGNTVGGSEAVEAQRSLACINHPDVRDYLVGLFSDLASNYDLDYIQTCLLLFDPGDNYRGMTGGGATWQRLLSVATGGCFCAACRSKALAEGLDWDAMTGEVRHLARLSRYEGLAGYHERQLLDEANYSESSLLIEFDAFTAWLQFRKRSVAELFERLRQALATSGRSVEFRYNTSMTFPERSGLEFTSAFRHVDSVRESDYSEQLGTPEAAGFKRARLMKARRALREDQKLIAGVGIRPLATPETIRRGIKAAVDSGCDGLSLGHYDGATMERLDAVRTGLREWEASESDWQPLTGSEVSDA